MTKNLFTLPRKHGKSEFFKTSFFSWTALQTPKLKLSCLKQLLKRFMKDQNWRYSWSHAIYDNDLLKHATFFSLWPRIFILMQNEIIVESYWPKKQTNKNQKKVTSYISISRAAGNNRRKFKQTDLRLQTWNECQKWLAFQTTCQAFQAIPIETGAYITLLCRSIHTFRLLTSFFCLRFTMKRQQRLSLFFTQKRMAIETENLADEAGEVSSVLRLYDCLL